MLTKSDITILMQQVDVTKAYDLLAMFKEAGKERIDIRTILDEAAPKIKDYSALVASICTLRAQGTLNASGDNILGIYLGEQHGDVFKARITRQADGSKRLDTKNPDKSLRGVPCDEVVLFTGVKYNEKKQCLDGTKIYDPQRGFKAALSAKFTEEGTLRLTGTVMGLSGHFIWKKTE